MPALGYGACVLVSTLLLAADAENLLLASIGVLLYGAALLTFFVIVTWYRDDDWLAAGFLFGITTMLAGAVAGVVVGVLETGSIGGAIVTAVGMLMAVVVRSILAVPIAGGIIALVRSITRKAQAGFAHQPGTNPVDSVARAAPTRPASDDGRSGA